jgi:hypothetical protein
MEDDFVALLALDADSRGRFPAKPSTRRHGRRLSITTRYFRALTGSSPTKQPLRGGSRLPHRGSQLTLLQCAATAQRLLLRPTAGENAIHRLRRPATGWPRTGVVPVATSSLRHVAPSERPGPPGSPMRRALQRTTLPPGRAPGTFLPAWSSRHRRSLASCATSSTSGWPLSRAMQRPRMTGSYFASSRACSPAASRAASAASPSWLIQPSLRLPRGAARQAATLACLPSTATCRPSRSQARCCGWERLRGTLRR